MDEGECAVSRKKRVYCIGLTTQVTLCGEHKRHHWRTSNAKRITCRDCLVQMDRTLECGLATIEQRDVPTYVMRYDCERVAVLTGIHAAWVDIAHGAPVKHYELWTWDEHAWSGAQNARQDPWPGRGAMNGLKSWLVSDFD